MYTDDNKNSISGDLERYDIKDYVTTFIIELEMREHRKISIKTPGEASRIRDLLNIPENTTFKSILDLRSDEPYWNRQDVGFNISNLGKNKGALFYFLCNGCRRKTKYLYSSSLLRDPRCRQCLRIPYKQPSRKTRNISRLINKDYLSSEAKYMLMKRAGITKSDIANYLSDLDK